MSELAGYLVKNKDDSQNSRLFDTMKLLPWIMLLSYWIPRFYQDLSVTIPIKLLPSDDYRYNVRLANKWEWHIGI